MSRPKPRPSAVRAQRRSMAGLVPGPKFGTFTPRRTGVIVALPRGGRGYTGSCEQLRTTGDDAPRAGPLTRPDVPIPRPCYRGLDVFSGARSPVEEAAMSTPHTYITTTIPYVNARPHIGHALELVQADVLARHCRARGDRVRFQAGTDDNSLKNVLAAEAAGAGVREFVDRNAEAFLALGGALALTVDDLIRTHRHP